MPRKLPEYSYPKGVLLRRVNNSGDISWHKNRVFISEVFRFEELAFEFITPGFYRVFFRDMEIGELNVEELRFRACRRVQWPSVGKVGRCQPVFCGEDKFIPGRSERDSLHADLLLHWTQHSALRPA